MFVKEHQRYYLIHSRWNKEVHAFFKSICPKVNIIAWLEFEPVYIEAAVQNVNHQATGFPPGK